MALAGMTSRAGRALDHRHTVLTKSPLGDRYGFYFYLGKEEKPHLGGNTITADQWQTIFIKMDQNTR